MFTAVCMLIVPVLFCWRVFVLCHRYRVAADKARLKFALENRDVA